MRIVALVYVGSELVHKLLLNAAVTLDFLVGKLDGLEHHALAHFLHLALNHHNVLLGSGNHKFEIGFLHLGECRVDDEFAPDAAYANLGNRASERQVAGSEGAGCCKSGERIRLDILLGGDEGYVYKYLEVEVIRPERTDWTIDKTRDKYLIIRRLTLSLHKAAREAAC